MMISLGSRPICRTGMVVPAMECFMGVLRRFSESETVFRKKARKNALF
jgi:hypothetical protein